MIPPSIQSGDAIRFAIALLPVLLFLAALRALDSYKLVTSRAVLASLGSGAAAAALCFLFNTFAFQAFPGLQEEYARFGAPVVEECAKAIYWIFLIATARVAFMADSAICGFAVGAGFAVAENIAYLHLLGDRGLGVWILRGLGTAIMHGGVTALGATITVYLLESRKWRGIRLYAPGLIAAMALHSLYNQSLPFPALSLFAAVAGIPLVLILVFYFSERSLRRWLGGKMDRDIEILNMIGSAQFKQTRVGMYLMSLRDAFPPELRGDMLSLLQLTIELSARAKGTLMIREAGFEVPPDPELENKFTELEYLQKSIGPTGMMAIRPLLSQTPRDLWELHRLERGLG